MQTLFGENEWVGQGKLDMNVLDRTANIWLKVKSFSTGEMAVFIKADILGDSIESTYMPDKNDPQIMRLNSTLIGVIEGKMHIENNFIGIEYGNEVLGYAGFEAFTFKEEGIYAYEGKFINCVGETCDIEAKCELRELSLKGGT